MSSDTPRGPRSTCSKNGKNELEHDLDSLEPAGPEKVPNNPESDSTAEENSYRPDFKSQPEQKPLKDADIDTPSG